MVKQFKHNAFTLVEMLVVMIMITVFIVASLQVFTKKRTVQGVLSVPHGKFECYWAGTNQATLYSKTTFGTNVGTATAVSGNTACKFTGNSKVTFYVVTLVGGGGGSFCNGSRAYTGTAGEFKSFFVSKITSGLLMIPGKGGTGSTLLNNSVLGGVTSFGGIYTSAGGVAAAGIGSTTSASSGYDNYIASLGYASGEPNAGNGVGSAIANSTYYGSNAACRIYGRGKTGAVLISW